MKRRVSEKAYEGTACDCFLAFSGLFWVEG